ncbi:hypothetical protein EIP91_009728, partial [Steccherinum ochraceum]
GDLMIEAKDKEQAVLMLYRIYNLHPVAYENLRPEKPPKPFVRSAKSQAVIDGLAAGEEDGEAEVEADGDGEPIGRRTRSGSGSGKGKGKESKGKESKGKEEEGEEGETTTPKKVQETAYTPPSLHQTYQTHPAYIIPTISTLPHQILPIRSQAQEAIQERARGDAEPRRRARARRRRRRWGCEGG